MSVRVEQSDEWVTKVAESSDERFRLGREAAVLRAVAHPAIVRLAGVEGPGAPTQPDRLRLHRTPGPSLVDAAAPSEEVAAGWGAAVATVIGDLHDLGFVHGALGPEHVLIDEQGRPIICGLGHARRVEEAGHGALEADVRAVAGLVAGLLGPGHDGVRRIVRQWETGRRRHRSGARAFARALVRAVPEATVMPIGPVGPADTIRSAAGGRQLEDGADSGGAGAAGVGGGVGGGGGGVGGGGGGGGNVAAAVERQVPGRAGRPLRRVPSYPGHEERRRLRLAAVGVLGLAAAGGFGWLAGNLSRPDRPGPTAPPAHSSAGVMANGPTDGYVLRSGRGEHPLTVVGRWGCGVARPAVLDTASGSVWTFPAWPSGTGALRATFVERVAGASGLAVVSRGASCDDLVVIRSGESDLRLALDRSA